MVARAGHARVDLKRAKHAVIEKQNRADRRKGKFGGGRTTGHGGWPTVQPNPVLGGATPAAGDFDPSDASDPEKPTKPTAETESPTAE